MCLQPTIRLHGDDPDREVEDILFQIDKWTGLEHIIEQRAGLCATKSKCKIDQQNNIDQCEQAFIGSVLTQFNE
jgi:hypothetical protein